MASAVLITALCAILLPDRARATVPADLCTGNPCNVTGSRTIDPQSALDFGATTDLRIKTGAVLTVGASAVPGPRSVWLTARSVVLEAGAKILGNGDDARVNLVALGGNVELAATAKIDLRADTGGTAWLTASGDVSIQGDVDVSATGTDSVGGAIALEADGAIVVATDLKAGAAGVESVGGEITIAAGTGVTLGGLVDVSSGTDGGAIDVYTAGGPISIAKKLSADGGDPAGYGGTIALSADYGDITVAGPLSALGGTGIEEQCGDGGEVDIAAGLSVSIEKSITLDGGTLCYGGVLDVTAGAGFSQASGTTISLKGPGEYGAGGSVAIDAFGDVTLRTIDLTSPGSGGDLDVLSSGGRVVFAGILDARGTGTFADAGAIAARGCSLEVSGQIDARGAFLRPNTGYIVLRASDALSVTGTLRALSENRLVLRGGAPTIAGTATIAPAPAVSVDPTIPACTPAPVCGNGTLEPGELCDEGAARNGSGAGCCAADCKSAKANGGTCDDGSFCNGADTCWFAACSVHAGDPCTSASGSCATSTCSETLHCSRAAGTSCDDGDQNPCTDGQCNGAGACMATSNHGTCDDGDQNPCTDGQCDATGACVATSNHGTCDDGDQNPCTDGQCDATGACVPTPNHGTCDDGTFCNGQEICSEGTCLRTQRSCPPSSCNEAEASCETFCGDGIGQGDEECGEPGLDACGVGETCRDCACEADEIRGDSYVCYAADPSAVPAWQFAGKALEVRDRFELKTFDVSSVATVCSPAVVMSAQGTYPPTSQGIAQIDHEIEQSATPANQPPFERSQHTFVDRFGTLKLTLTQPGGLLLRSRVADFGPIEACETSPGCSGGRTCQSGFCLPDPPSPPAKAPKVKAPVDNYKCYKVKLQIGAPRFRRVKSLWVADQLGAVLLYDAVKPLRVCSPAGVAGLNAAARNKPGQLTCYKAKRSASQPPQAAVPPHTVAARYEGFAPAFLDLAGAKEICVPSLVDAAP